MIFVLVLFFCLEKILFAYRLTVFTDCTQIPFTVKTLYEGVVQQLWVRWSDAGVLLHAEIHKLVHVRRNRNILFVCNLRMWLLHDIFPRFEQPETRHAQFNKYQECVKNSLVHVICNYESQISVKKISLAQNRSGIFTSM